MHVYEEYNDTNILDYLLTFKGGLNYIHTYFIMWVIQVKQFVIILLTVMLQLIFYFSQALSLDVLRSLGKLFWVQFELH